MRFVLVGALNTLFSYAVYAALLYVGIPYAAAYLLSLVLGIFFSFKTQGAWVFRNTDGSRIVRFVLVWSLIYVGNLFVIARFQALGFDAYLSGLLAIPFATVVAFVAQKYYVFTRHRRPSPPD